jgi:inner membrane protein
MSFATWVNPLFARTFTVAAIVVALLVPLGQVESLVSERSVMRDSAEARVAAGWGGEQVIGGPVLAVPVDTRERDPTDDKREVVRRGWRYLLPATVDASTSLAPVERHSGIYRVNAYTANVSLTARFTGDSLLKLLAVTGNSAVAWSEVRLLLPIRELRGIREITLVSWNGHELAVSPALDGIVSGISAPVDLSAGAPMAATFEFRGVIAGTKNFAVLPFGRTTTVHIRSAWPHPSFSGVFLPARYTLTDAGFDATWQVLEVNRSYPQSWSDTAVSGNALASSAFGVELYDPVDVYQRNYRAIHYAVLFIALTFLCLFLWEQVAKRRLHAMQYLLIGLALATFYLLLIALSEHMGFGLAYGMAALGQVIVLGVYLVGAMRARLAGSLAAVGLASVYGALYLLVLSEQYALLLGAVFLFVTLAAVLWITRRVDWHAMTKEMASGSSS